MTEQSPTSAFARRWTLAGLMLTITACAPTLPTAPATPGVDPLSGISNDALAGVAGMTDLGDTPLFIVVYYPSKVDPAQLAAAPARICKSRGRTLASAEEKPLEHASEIPGTRKLVVRCN